MLRRNFIKAGAALTMLNGLGVGKARDVPAHNWDRYDFGSGPVVTDRLNQGPFGIEQDEGWYIAYSPEIPGANGQGRTKEEALKSLRDAIELILQDRREEGMRGVPPTAIRETVIVG